jgi:hypothetical protein
MWKIHDKEFREYVTYNIICNYIVFNKNHGYGVLKHFMGCLGAYVLRYYYKLEVAYNKYYLKHTTTISHKPTFVMARRDPILDTIDKRVQEDSMVVGAEVGRFTKELCIQRCTKRNNDINCLALPNKKTKSTCSPSTFWKEPNIITSCYFQSRPHGKATSKELEESNGM